MMILTQHLSEAVAFRITRLQHISNEMDGIRIVFVEVEELQHLVGVVIAGFNTMRELLSFMFRDGYQQHGVFWNIIFSRHNRIRSNHRSRVKIQEKLIKFATRVPVFMYVVSPLHRNILDRLFSVREGL